MKRIFENKNVLAVIALLTGLGIGWVFFHSPGNVRDNQQQAGRETASEQTWTCAMHPQIRSNEPGLCPICGMELIPVSEVGAGPNIVEMSEEAARLSNIQTVEVGFMLPEKEIYLQGKVQVDERRVQNQVSHLTGRIERLYVSFTGETVSVNQKLASLYSPELITAQKELFEAVKSRSKSPVLYHAARSKLRQWKLTDAQVDELEKAGTVKEVVDIHADIGGVVLKRHVSVGDHVKGGGVLFTVADLSRVWVGFEAYEADIPWLQVGHKVKFTVSSLPGLEFSENVAFVDPIIDSQTRTASVRLDVNNKSGQLKPEMFATGIITARLPIREAQLAIPKSAVMWTGKRSVVYVAVPGAAKPMFEFRQVNLGHDLGGYFIVEDGLKEGEVVVANGAFKVDAAAQLAGKKSMMNQKGGLSSTAHVHSESGAYKKAEGMAEASLSVSGNCAMCKSRIEKAIRSVDGVAHAVWDKETGMATIHFDSARTNKTAIADAVSKAGHDNEIGRAAAGTYDGLPECCRYTRDH